MGGPLGTPCNTPEVDSGTLARTRSTPRGVTGTTAAGKPIRQGKPGRLPFTIHLDLKDLIEIDVPGVGAVSKSGSLKKVDVFVKHSVTEKDVDRPKKVLAIVRKLFAPLADVIKIELDTPKGSDRLLRVHFGWPLVNTAGKPQVSKKHGQFYDPVYVGAGAQSQSRSRVEKFAPVKGDADKGVTAYVFEGALKLVIEEYFSGKVNYENIFATAIVHELGHNLGLQHVGSSSDIMFVYAKKTEKEPKKWMTAAEKNSLKFSSTQITSIRELIQKP